MGRKLRSKRGMVAAAGILLLALIVAAAGWYVLLHSAPGRFTLVASRPSPTTSPSPENPAELARNQAFCAEFAPPNEQKRCLAGTSAYKMACDSLKASSQTTPAGRWLIAPGSEAGFRVHERFLDVPIPNEAVARTDHVAGGMLITTAAGSLQIAHACVAVSTLSLHSVDVVPGFKTTDRDGTIPDVLGGLYNPVAFFRTDGFALPSPAGEGQKQTVRLTGSFTVHGDTKPVAVTVEGVVQGGQLQVAGSFPITLADYGMAPPENPIAAVDSKATIEFHLYLDRR